MEVDAICDGEQVLIPGIMEHVERAGVHSGDSMAIYPGLTLTSTEVDTLVDYTTRIALGLGTKGLTQYSIRHHGDWIPIATPRRSSMAITTSRQFTCWRPIPRSSRTVPFLSKVTGVPMVQLATRVVLGRTLREQGYTGGLWKKAKLVGVKAPVFSMSKLVGVDTYLGPEMKSTGEVMGS